MWKVFPSSLGKEKDNEQNLEDKNKSSWIHDAFWWHAMPCHAPSLLSQRIVYNYNLKFHFIANSWSPFLHAQSSSFIIHHCCLLFNEYVFEFFPWLLQSLQKVESSPLLWSHSLQNRLCVCSSEHGISRGLSECSTFGQETVGLLRILCV
jgi:hypothetical protein